MGKKTALWMAVCLILPAQNVLALDDTAAVATATATAPVAERPAVAEPMLLLKLPEAPKVAFAGVVSYDSTGTAGAPMLYVAPGLIGLLAAAATHGAIVTAANEGKKQKLRDKADEVLIPYGDVLNSYKYDELMQASLSKMTSGGSKRLLMATTEQAPGSVIIETASVFSMTQDHRALVLDNLILIKKAGDQSGQFSTAVRIVSAAKDAPDQIRYWNDDQGLNLKSTTASMFADSLDLALAERANITKADLPFKTVRYMEGGIERVERAQPISEHCSRMLMKTLRGNLMSVPLKTPSLQPGSDCTPAEVNVAPAAPVVQQASN